MKIIAYGKKSISDAVQTAEVVLVLGVKSVVIECVPAATVEVVSPGTLAFCPVTDCSECQAAPCPFGYKPGNKIAELQAEYSEAETRLNEISRKLREATTHG